MPITLNYKCRHIDHPKKYKYLKSVNQTKDHQYSHRGTTPELINFHRQIVSPRPSFFPARKKKDLRHDQQQGGRADDVGSGMGVLPRMSFNSKEGLTLTDSLTPCHGACSLTQSQSVSHMAILGRGSYTWLLGTS